MKIKLLLPLLSVLIFGLILFFSLENKSSNSQPNFAMAGKSVPNFTLTELKTEQKIDQQIFQGGWKILNIWASWCTFCKSEHDFLMDLANKKIPIIGLNYRDLKKDALSVLINTGDPYTINLFDPQGSLALDLGNTITPETYLIDPQGILVFRYSGALNQDIWQKEFEPRILAFNEKNQ